MSMLDGPGERSDYRGILKHKKWKPGGGFGTLCPEWTHRTAQGGFSGDPSTYPWPRTAAHLLFSIDDGEGHRYAAQRGIAFKAHPSNDGTWHGYPIPWHDVPVKMQDLLIEKGQAERRALRRQRSIPSDDIHWALRSDDD